MDKKEVNKRRGDVKSSPFAGCSLVFAAMLSMLFLVGFVVWNLFKLDSEISKFTGPDAILTPVPVLLDEIEDLNELKAGLNQFELVSAAGVEKSALSLRASDINLAIAAYEPFKELRQTFSVKSIENDRLYIQISFPMRGKPMSDEFRFLNGTMVATPKLIDSEIILEVEEIIVPDAEVPSGFLGQLSPYRITEKYKEHELLGPWMSKLTNVSIEGDRLVMTIRPGIEKPLEKDTIEMKPAIKRSLMLFGILLGFLVITIVLFLFIRSKTKPSALPPEE